MVDVVHVVCMNINFIQSPGVRTCVCVCDEDNRTFNGDYDTI